MVSPRSEVACLRGDAGDVTHATPQAHGQNTTERCPKRPPGARVVPSKYVTGTRTSTACGEPSCLKHLEQFGFGGGVSVYFYQNVFLKEVTRGVSLQYCFDL